VSTLSHTEDLHPKVQSSIVASPSVRSIHTNVILKFQIVRCFLGRHRFFLKS
jgi:hypothetical protein